MDIIKMLHQAEKKLLKEQTRIDKELTGLKTAIVALGKRALTGKAGTTRGRKKGSRVSPATLRKMKAAQRKRRQAEKQQA